MNENLDWALLATYLFSECSEEEAALIDADPELQSLIEDLRRVWVVTGRSPTRWDADANWSRVQAHVRQRKARERGLRADDRRSVAGKSRRSRNRIQRAVGAAAIMAIVVVASVIAVKLQSGGLSGAKTYATNKGEQATVHLSDGTLTRINADSRLTVSAEFGKRTRELRLEGEAFFEVTGDSSRPFVVHAGEAVVRVFGTRFGVHAYPQEGDVEIVVTEGMVGFHRKQSSVSSETVLTAGQIGQIDSSGDQIVRRDADVSIRLAWMNGDLAFRRASFEHVIRTLERRLDLAVTLDGISTVPGHLNARFVEQQPVEEIISIIAATFGLTYEFEDGTVTFRNPPSGRSEARRPSAHVMSMSAAL